MMMIEDVVALVRSVHDGDHMLADGVFLLRLLHLLEALDLVLDLDHAHRHLRRTQIQDLDRVNPRLAWTGHDLKPPFLAAKFFPEIARLLHGDAGDQWPWRTQKGNCINAAKHRRRDKEATGLPSWQPRDHHRGPAAQLLGRHQP